MSGIHSHDTTRKIHQTVVSVLVGLAGAVVTVMSDTSSVSDEDDDETDGNLSRTADNAACKKEEKKTQS